MRLMGQSERACNVPLANIHHRCSSMPKAVGNFSLFSIPTCSETRSESISFGGEVVLTLLEQHISPTPRKKAFIHSFHNIPDL